MPKIENYPDALAWWKKYHMMFSSLVFLAKKYLSIHATSVLSEQIFSKASRIINEKRTILTVTVEGAIIVYYM